MNCCPLPTTPQTKNGQKKNIDIWHMQLVNTMMAAAQLSEVDLQTRKTHFSFEIELSCVLMFVLHHAEGPIFTGEASAPQTLEIIRAGGLKMSHSYLIFQ